MAVVVATPPAAVVSLNEAKAYLGGIEFGDDNDLITSLIESATAYLDGPAGILNRCIGAQSLTLTRSSFLDDAGCSEVELPYGPVIEVTTVKYYDSAGVLQTVDSSDYRLIGGSLLVPAYGGSWPTPRSDDGAAVEITYQAGYETVPPGLKNAILQHVAHNYRNREAVSIGAVSMVPLGYEETIRPFHVWSV